MPVGVGERGQGEVDVPRRRLPFVGEDFNVTRAGIHADGLVKDEEIYNPFDTTALLGHAPGVAISDKSGAAGLLLWLRRHRPGLAAGVTKRDPRLGGCSTAWRGRSTTGGRPASPTTRWRRWSTPRADVEPAGRRPALLRP